MSSLLANLGKRIPTRESIAENRWTRPFARHLLRPDLWHLNRRSVPRGVAVGLLIAPIIPIAHTLLAALAAVPTRANVAIAAGITWLINPFTVAPFYYAAYRVGTAILRVDAITPMPQVAHPATGQATHWAAWLLAKSGPLALGTLVLSIVIASTGYLVASFGWRWSIGRKWRSRAHRHGKAA